MKRRTFLQAALGLAAAPAVALPLHAGEEDVMRRVLSGGVDVLEMRHLAVADLAAQGVTWPRA